MEQLKFGISSMNLGGSTKSKPSKDIVLSEWEDAAAIKEFYRAGGHFLKASDTECRFLWDEDALYVLFLCTEEKRSEKEAPIAEKDRTRLKRKDRVEIAVQSGGFGHRDFSVFVAENNGRTTAQTQKGMTYLGGDLGGYLGGRDRIENQAEITEIAEDAYVSTVKPFEKGWMAYLALPWKLSGGKPKEQFALQVYRKKYQTSDISTPFPLDMQVNFSDRFEYDPLTFLEVFLNGEKGANTAEGVLCTLPDGVKRWQRPVKLVWPSEEERREIEALHQSKEPTTEENLADRIRVLQRWQDVLTLEGMDFFTGQSVSNPWEFREPWVERRFCNEALLQKDMEKACREIDTAIAYFAKLTKWWYADHTLGNVSESWEEPGELRNVSCEENRICLSFAGGQKLYVSAGAGGFRFHMEQKGYFDAQEDPITLKGRDTLWIAEAACGTLRITTGAQWKLEIEGTDFSMSSGQLRLYSEDGKETGTEWSIRLRREDGVYGFGECFDEVNQRGKVRTLWQRDACEGCLASIGNQSYKVIPLVHISAGYAVFLNSHYRIRADIAHETADLLRFQVSGPVTDFFVWCGTPSKIMDCYSRLTGRPILPPKWVFEPWAGGGAGRWYLGPLHDVCKEQMAVLEQFEELDIPHAGIYAEGAGAEWFTEPRPEELYKIVAFAEKKGVHAFSWQNPDMTQEAAQRYMPDVATEDLPINKIAPHEGDKQLPTYIDFTHPKGMDLLRAQWKTRLDAGIRGTMVDFGDFVPEEAIFYDGRTGKEMHNGYAYEYAKGYRKLFYERYGEDHVLYTRGAAPGSQSCGCQFAGDHLTSFLGMTYALRGGLTAAASGLPFWGVDVTGYDGFSDEETYLRWTEWAAFCPIMRYHGTEPREPWEYNEETVQIYKRYAWLRENLLPYSYGLAVHAHETGMPMMRPLSMELPGKPELVDCDDEYFYGPDLLVAPIHSEGEERIVVFPEGRWTDFRDNTNVITESGEQQVYAPIDQIPVYLREGAFLPMELNGNLIPGESMTTSRKKCLVVTPPVTERDGVWNRDRTDRVTYQMRPEEKGFHMTVHGTGEWEYLLIKGLSDKPRSIRVNGREYPECVARTALYFEEGWFMQKDGTVIVRLYDHSETELQVEM